MSTRRLPTTDSIEELARFWDSHDLSDFSEELEEVPEPVFERRPGTVVGVRPEPDGTRRGEEDRQGPASGG